MEYIGFDYHKQYSFATSINSVTGEMRRAKLSNTAEALDSFIKDKENTHTVLESCRTWHILYELLKDRVADVKLAHPYKVKAIASARIKTDKIDSRILAELLAADLIPEAHIRGNDNRNKQSVLRQRAFFVATQTRIKNRIHYIVDSQHHEIRKTVQGLSDLFGKAGLKWLRATEELSETDRKHLDQMLDMYDCVYKLIAQTNSLVHAIFKNDPNAQLLETIPGIGKFLAVLISTEIDTIGRFDLDGQFTSYTGLVPSTYSSGGTTWHGKITKQGNKWLRWAFIESANAAKRYNAQFNSFYTERAVRIGKNKATVALARRIATIAFKILKEQRIFIEYKKPCKYQNF